MSDITKDMVERGTEVLTWFVEGSIADARDTVRAVLSAALKGMFVAELPKPNRSYDGELGWITPNGEVVTAYVNADGLPCVETELPNDDAARHVEAVCLAGIAAARAAREMVGESDGLRP